MKKRLLILSLCLSVGACTLGLTACGHTHSYTDVVTAPTCTEQGYTTHTCECGDVKVDTYVEALDHSFTDYVSNNDATCLDDGTKTAKCDRCDVTDTIDDVDSALDHSFTDYVSNDDATCLEDGTKTAKCDRCDVTDTIDDVDSALGHSFTDYVDNGDLTETAVCDNDNCEETDTREIDGLKFNTLIFTDKKASVKVSNNTETYSFVNEIIKSGKSNFIVSLDEFGIQTSASKIVPLNVGNNKVYILETIYGDVINTYEITIRRKPMYVVTFNTQGSSIDGQTIEEDSFAVEPETSPTRAGYTFDGWDFDFSSAITDNTTINAKWTANTNTPYKVEYYLENLENNNYTRLDGVTENLTDTTDTTVYAEIKTFDHFTAESSSVSANLNGNGSTVLKVYYQRNYYNVSVNKLDNKGTVTGSGSFANAEDVTVTATVNVGYTFNGWYDGETRVSENLSYTFNPVKNITLTAKWSANTNTPYKVEYYLENLDNNNYTRLDSATENLTGTTDTTVTAEIKTFDHFTVENNLVRGNLNGNGSTVLKVYYQRNEYTVTFDGNGGTRTGGGALSQKIKYQGSATAPTFTKTGHSFEFDKSLDNINESTTITAQWTINQYTLTIKYNNGQDDLVLTQDYNSEIQSINNPERGGYSFTGWDKTIPSVMPAQNQTITAKWNAIFSLNGGTITDLTYYGEGLREIVIPNEIDGVKITSIGNSAFSDCDSLRSVTIGDSVESIGYEAFYDCSSLTSVTIPDSVESIGSYAFEYCSSLTSVTIGDSVESIGGWAFSYCSSLTSVTIGDSVKSIGYGAFEYCSSLTKTNYLGTIDQWAMIHFNGDHFGAMTPGNPGHLYIKGEKVTEVKLTTATYIGTNAFFGFYLTSVTIGDSVKRIGSGAFACSSITSITIPDSVESIGYYAFGDCRSLESITIGTGVKNIEFVAFGGYDGCISLENITYSGTIQEWNAITKGSWWNDDVPATFVQCSDGRVDI